MHLHNLAPPPQGDALAPDVSTLWVIGADDAKEYFLSGTFKVDPPADRKPPGEGHVWRGTIAMPAVRIVPLRRR